MGQVTEQQVMESLKAVIEPGSGADIVSREMVAGLVIKDGNVGFVIEVDPREGAHGHRVPRLGQKKSPAVVKAISTLPHHGCSKHP
jgi:ATP-binding protein involved in chromosome partitioning